MVQVTKGSLTFTQKDCKSKTYSAGDTFIEVPYAAGRVVGIGEAAMTATSILGYGDPLQVNVPNPCP